MLQVETNKTSKANLLAKNIRTKEHNRKTVTLASVVATVNDEVPLVFEMHGKKPERYLGALGHVVIIDENMEQYIHVHPASKKTTTFNAHFTKPGKYKLWADLSLLVTHMSTLML